MDSVKKTFISSTFWTERIGPAAALKTLEVMEKTNSWCTITNSGKYLRSAWDKLAKKYSIPIVHNGLYALTGFSIPGPNTLAYKTLITQEMLKRGYLAATSCYLSVAHSKEIIDSYLEQLDPVFQLISDCESGRSVVQLLDGPICHSGFQRLN